MLVATQNPITELCHNVLTSIDVDGRLDIFTVFVIETILQQTYLYL